MTLNFPDSPSTGDIYNDSTSGFQYEWNGTVWISTDPQRAANIKELDDISSGFNGSTTQFNLTVSSSGVSPVSDAQLLISVGGVMQNPTNDYTVSGSTITFTTAPSAGLTFFGTFLGQALSLNTVQDGTVEFASFKTGTAGVGIKQRGSQIGVGITQIDFVGTANTVVAVGNTVSVDVTGGIHTTGLSRFSEITASGLNVLGIGSVKDLRSVGITTLTTGSATNFTVTNLVGTSATATTLTATNFNTTHTTVSGVATVTGIIDGNGGANISGGAGLVASSAKISDLTSGRVTYAGGSGELQDSGNLTFSGSELTASSATVSDLTDNRVVIAGSSGALEDSSNLTFDGSTLTVNGDVSVAGTITYQEVSEIDAVGFVTARKGVRVTNGGIIVTAGLSTFSDDVKFAGANYDITYDRSADSIIWNDNAQAIFGTGSDMSIFHNGTYSAIRANTFYLQDNNGSGHAHITCVADGAVGLRYDNTERLATTSVGVNVVGNVDCDSLNNAGISTFGSNVSIAGGLSFPDHSSGTTGMGIWGTGSDMKIYHNGTNAIVDNDTGKLLLLSNDIWLKDGDDGDVHAKFNHDGGSEFYYNNNKRIEVTDAGANITAQSTQQAGLIVGQTGSANAIIYIDASNGDAAGGDYAYLRQSDGSSGATFTIANMQSGGINFSVGSGAGGAGQAVRIDNSGRVAIGTTTEGHASADDLTIAGSADVGITVRSGDDDNGSLFFSDATSGTGEYQGYVQYNHNNNSLLLASAGTNALTLDSSQNATFAGSVSDSKGNLRSIPSEAKSGAHTLVAADAGKTIYTSTGGVTVNNSVMSAGDAVTIINNSGSDQTITQGSGVTLYLAADASTGNRTLAGRGMVTIWFASASVAYISGGGLS